MAQQPMDFGAFPLKEEDKLDELSAIAPIPSAPATPPVILDEPELPQASNPFAEERKRLLDLIERAKSNDDIAKAMEDKNRNDALAMMLSGANDLSAGLVSKNANAQIQADNSFADEMRKRGEEGVATARLNRDSKLKDLLGNYSRLRESMQDQLTLDRENRLANESVENRKLRQKQMELTAEANKLNKEMQDNYKQKNFELRKQIFGNQQNDQLEKRVTSLDTDLRKSGLLSDAQVFNNIENLLKKVNPKGSLDNPESFKGKDVPGVGFGISSLPDFMVSGEGVDFRQNVARLANTLLQKRSGAAVTDAEYRRFLEETGKGNFGTERDLLLGLKKMKQDILNQTKSIESRSPDAIEEFRKRGGVVPSDILGSKTSKVEIFDPETGRRGLIPSENLEKALKINPKLQVIK